MGQKYVEQWSILNNCLYLCRQIMDMIMEKKLIARDRECDSILYVFVIHFLICLWWGLALVSPQPLLIMCLNEIQVEPENKVTSDWCLFLTASHACQAFSCAKTRHSLFKNQRKREIFLDFRWFLKSILLYFMWKW